jgi:hypothetical protein
MNIYKKTILFLALFALLVAPCQASAEEARGYIAGIDPNGSQILFVTRIGQNLIFEVPENCQIMVNGQPASLLELRGGDGAIINFERRGLFGKVAYSIRGVRR